MESIVNKVAESGLLTLNLEDYLPKEPIMVFDLKDFLYMQMILKEKDYREALKEHNWQQYANAIVCINCTADAIVPMWANMLACTYLQPIAQQVFFGNVETITHFMLTNNINNIDALQFIDKRIVVKGCGNKAINESAYVAITAKLLPVAKSIMYGEPCSTVPIYKKPKVQQL